MTTMVASQITEGAHIFSSWGEAIVDSITKVVADVLNEDRDDIHHTETIKIQMHYASTGSYGQMKVLPTHEVEVV